MKFLFLCNETHKHFEHFICLKKNNVDTKSKAFLSSSLFYVALLNSKEIDKQLHPCTCWWLSLCPDFTSLWIYDLTDDQQDLLASQTI